MALADEAFAQYQNEGYVGEDVLDDDERSAVKSRLSEYTHGDRDPETFVAQNEPAVERGEIVVDDPGNAVEVPMEPESALFPHCLLPQYTAPNATIDWRRALIMSYMFARSRFIQSAEERPDYADSHHVAGESFPGCV